jgi:ribosomal protein L40E
MPNRAAVIVALILNHPLCTECLATKSGLSLADLDTSIATIEASLILRHAADRCRACGSTDATLSVGQTA